MSDAEQKLRKRIADITGGWLASTLAEYDITPTNGSVTWRTRKINDELLELVVAERNSNTRPCSKQTEQPTHPVDTKDTVSSKPPQDFSAHLPKPVNGELREELELIVVYRDNTPESNEPTELGTFLKQCEAEHVLDEIVSICDAHLQAAVREVEKDHFNTNQIRLAITAALGVKTSPEMMQAITEDVLEALQQLNQGEK